MNKRKCLGALSLLMSFCILVTGLSLIFKDVSLTNDFITDSPIEYVDENVVETPEVEGLALNESFDEDLALNNKEFSSGSSSQKVGYENNLKDYSIPTEEKHAYDPFAQMETEEETEEYRGNVKYEKNQVIYKVKESKKMLSSAYSSYAKKSELTDLGIDVASAEELHREKIENGVFADEYEATYVASLNGDVWETVDALANVEGVLNAQPNYLYEDTAIDVPTITHNPHLDKQWHHGKDHLECDKHWQHMHDQGVTAGEGAVVAVIDTGVDYTHPDLAANMWVNTAEFNGAAGVDDDGNGYVDDIYGVSTVGASYYHSGDPMDDHGHGTHVAGIIAMTANNDEGAVGLAYGAKIMAIKAGQATGIFSDTDIAEAIRYAKAMGADVINMSFGGTGKSFLVEEALADAFSSCVLVAAAGNDGIPTADAPDDFLKKTDFYPAGYSFVLGVMASDQNGELASFSNWDYYNNGGSAEYEMTAPGVDIFSTLPGGQYASWDGTSMAAPLVSAAAALVRSAYQDKGTYSSRFIMGQLASATDKTLSYIDKIGKAHSYTMLDLDASLNNLPEPNLTVKNTYLFDDPAIDPANDGDGIIDAGETIDLGLVIRNQWGKAGNVTITVDAISTGGIANPNIEWITDTITIDEIGTFNEQNNGFIYENDALVGVDNPIRFKINDDCINDANIAINITITCTNALDAEDTNVYEYNPDGFELSFYVQRGRSLSGNIMEDMTLTKDDYWIIENAVYIPEGVTVTVEPGTQIQFWPSDYNPKSNVYIDIVGDLFVNGTDEEPVEMFPSAAFSDKEVKITGGSSSSGKVPYDMTGYVEMDYVKILNPYLGIDSGNYLNLTTNSVGKTCWFAAMNINNSNFSNLNLTAISGFFNSCVFDNCVFSSSWESTMCYSCVFRHNSKTFDGKVHNSVLYDPMDVSITYYKPDSPEIFTFGDSKYIALSNSELPTAAGGRYVGENREDLYYYHFKNNLAKSKGGYLATINSDEEMAFLSSKVDEIDSYTNVQIGGIVSENNELCWTDGISDYNNGITWDSTGIQYVTLYAKTGDVEVRSTVGSMYLFEFPNTVSDEVIKSDFSNDVILETFYNLDEEFDYKYHGFNNNAILNTLNLNDSDSWLKIQTNQNLNYIQDATNNYWGTTNEKLIDAQIIDGNTKINTGDILTTPYLTLESPEIETIYPFVTEAYITDTEGNRINSCGYEEIQLHVKFNRDMDTSVSPMVSYGPAEPYTDYVVDGEFIDARHWVGTTKVTSSIDSGTEFIRVKDAVSADDAWLKTGTDAARFQFSISTTGAEALTLQAVGGENKVELSWIQDDYDTLAGFNVYRSTSADGTFTKINDRLIPGTIREFVDKDVEPGVEYFYYFTVMGTDLIESNPSNTASAIPIDNIKPLLTHNRVLTANYGEAINFNVTASDNIGLSYVKLFYRAKGADAFTAVDMTNISGNDYFVSVAGKDVPLEGLEYYIEISDGVSVVRDGSAFFPIEIAVDNTMVIYSVSPYKVDVSNENDITAVLTGVNFSDSMILKVGGKEVEYTFVSSSQITFTIPAGSVGRVDIVLVDGERDARLTNAITYTDSQSEIQIVTPAEAKAREAISLPVVLSAKGDAYGVDIKLQVDKSLYSAISFVKSENNASAITSCSTDYYGNVKISMASADVIDTSAPIGYLVLTPKDVSVATTTSVQITEAKVNAVEIPNLIDCNLIIRPNFTLSGKITYYNSDEGVEGVKVTLSNGMVTYTDANGNYTFTGITTNNIIVTPDYEGNVNGAISAQDAALVLQAITDEEQNLSDMQFIAADVDGDGELTALDASYILQKSVGKIEGEFSGTGEEWAFSDKNKVIVLTSSQENVNFSAILLGDVTGDWTKEPEEELE